MLKSKARAPRQTGKARLKARVDATLNRLVQAELIKPSPEEEPTFLFEHALLEDAAYDSLLKQERRRLHRLVGESLERAYPDQLDTVAALLANHFAQADDDARAFAYAVRAGDAALRIYATAEATQYFDRALALASRLPDLPSATVEHLYLARGRTFELSTRYADALRNYEEMQELARRRGDRALGLTALIQHATLHTIPSYAQDLPEARRLSDEALELARTLNDRRAEATIRRNLMLLSNFQGDLRQAVQYGEESLAIARELHLTEQVAFTLNDLFRPYASIGEYERARAVTDEARAIWRATGNLAMLADNLSRSARVAVALGAFERALAFSVEARQISEDIGNLWGQSFCRMFVAYVYLERGELTTGIETMQECIRLGDESGFILAQIATRADLGWCYGTLGDVARGLELANAARARAEQRVPTFRAWTYASLARLHVLEGDLDQAEQMVHEGYAALPEDWAQHAPIEMPLAEAELALARNDPARAAEAMDRLLERLRAFHIRTFLADALLIRGIALARMGRLDSAAQVLSDARGEAESIGSRRVLWQILAACSEVETRRGDLSAAQALRAQAREIVQYMADHISDEQLRASFLKRSAPGPE